MSEGFVVHGKRSLPKARRRESPPQAQIVACVLPACHSTTREHSPAAGDDAGAIDAAATLARVG
jgi:hypothetical protein